MGNKILKSLRVALLNPATLIITNNEKEYCLHYMTIQFKEDIQVKQKP